MRELEAKIYELLLPEAEAVGCTIYDITLKRVSDRLHLHVFLHNEKGVSFDMCEHVNVRLGEIMEVKLNRHGCYIEVSSRGLERELRKPQHFIGAIGENVSVKQKGKAEYAAKIIAADENAVTLETQAGETKVELDAIQQCNVIYEWNS